MHRHQGILTLVKRTSDATATEGTQNGTGADDGARTRDLQLGKLTCYQLHHIRSRALSDHSGGGPASRARAAAGAYPSASESRRQARNPA